MSNKKYKTVAFIPARSGSKRIRNKNIYPIKNHPLLAYTITTAIESEIFDSVICATDDIKYAQIAEYYGAEVPFLRTSSDTGDKSADIEWVTWLINELRIRKRVYDVFSILRPTSPLRQTSTIKRAFDKFYSCKEFDSLRAIEKCHEHPGKMWIVRDDNMFPLLPFSNDQVPWHSSQYDALPEIYVQNASLEIAWTKTITNKKSISGQLIIPFITEMQEGFDINYPDDIIKLNHLIESGEVKLPSILKKSYFDI